MPRVVTYDRIQGIQVGFVLEGTTVPDEITFRFQVASSNGDSYGRTRTVTLTAGQRTAMQNFIDNKLAEIRTAEGVT